MLMYPNRPDLSLAPVGKAVDNRAGIFGNRCLARAAARCLRKRQRGIRSATTPWGCPVQMATGCALRAKKHKGLGPCET